MMSSARVGAAARLSRVGRGVAMETRNTESSGVTDGIVVVGRIGATETRITESGGMTDAIGAVVLVLPEVRQVESDENLRPRA